MDGLSKSFVSPEIDNPRFRADVERALKRFEHTTEWADLISCLAKLNKVLQSYHKAGCLPKAATICKRLAQCLHHSLPPGVHLKALESYRLIFDILGPKGIGIELPYISLGLFPLFVAASIPVRRELLTLYEGCLLGLGKELKPSLVGLLAGLFAGLDEGSEFVERVAYFLENIEEQVGCPAFYSALWIAIVSYPSARLASFQYLLTKVDRKRSLDDQISLLGESLEAAISALSASLLDTQQVLVQRASLDLISVMFPLSSCSLVPKELSRLLEPALLCLLRRDMSLNRRLYAWLLGPESDNPEYFLKFSHKNVVECLGSVFCRSNVNVDGWAKMTRSVIYLMDNDFLGHQIMPEVIIPLLSSARTLSLTSGAGSGDATISKTLNLFVNGLDPGFLWTFLTSKLADTSEDSSSFLQICRIVFFCVDHISLDGDLNIRNYHIPSLLVVLLQCITRMCRAGDLTSEMAVEGFRLCGRILSCVDVCNPFSRADVIQEQQSVESACSSETMMLHVREETIGAVPHFVTLFQDNVQAVSALCTWINRLSDYPIYVTGEWQKMKDLGTVASPEQSPWIDSLCALSTRANTPIATLQSLLTLLMRLLSESMTVREQLTILEARSNGNGWAGRIEYGGIQSEGCLSANRPAMSASSQNLARHARDLEDNVSDDTGVSLDSSGQERGRALDPADASKLAEFGGNICSSPSITLSFPDKSSNTDTVNGDCTGKGLANTRTPSATNAPVTSPLSLLTSLGSSLVASSPSLVALRDPELEAIVVSPILTPSLAAILSKNSAFFQNVCDRLWSEMGSDQTTGENAVGGAARVGCCVNDAGELLCRLHYCDVSEASSVCENMLVRHLMECSSQLKTDTAILSTCQKIFGIWSIHRRIQQTVGSQKPFHRLTLAMLSLVNQKSAIGYACKSWLTDCLDHGDAARLLEPLLLTLVHPSTSRIALAYTSISRVKKNLYVLQTTHGQKLFHCVSDEEMVTMSNYYGSQPDDSILGGAIDLGLGDLEGETVDGSEGGWSGEGGLEEDSSISSTTPMVESSVEVCVREVLSDLLSKVVDLIDDEIDLGLVLNGVMKNEKIGSTRSESVSSLTSDFPLNPVHAHVLLYQAVYDGKRVCRAIESLLALMQCDWRLALTCFLTTPVGNLKSDHTRKLMDLLTRHQRAVLGNEFWSEILGQQSHGEKPGAIGVGGGKTSQQMFIDLILSLTLNFLRSYYLRNPSSMPSADDLGSNLQVRLESLIFLTNLMENISNLVMESGKTLAQYSSQIVAKSRMQTLVLHLLLLASSRFQPTSALSTLYPSIASFNHSNQPLVAACRGQLLKLAGQLIRFEFIVRQQTSISVGSTGSSIATEAGDLRGSGMASWIWTSSDRRRLSLTIDSVNLSPSHALTFSQCMVSQRLFMNALLNALRSSQYAQHSVWLELFVDSLPFLDGATSALVLHTTEQICKNLENCLVYYEDEVVCADKKHNNQTPVRGDDYPPADYVARLLECLTALCHFSLLDPQESGISSKSMSVAPGVSKQHGFSIMKALKFDESLEASGMDSSKKHSTPRSEAKSTILAALPHLFSSLLKVWAAAASNRQPRIPIGASQTLRRLMLELASPIALNHPRHFLSALAMVWMNRASSTEVATYVDGEAESISSLTEDQKNCIDFIMSIAVLPLEALLNFAVKTLKDPIRIKKAKNPCPVEGFILEMIQQTLEFSSPAALSSACNPLTNLVAEVQSLASATPNIYFLCLRMLSSYINKCSVPDEKSLVKNMQDQCSKLVEKITGVIANPLEHSTFFGKALVLRTEALPDAFDDNRKSVNNSEGKVVGSISKTVLTRRPQLPAYTQALQLLSNYISGLFDALYKNEDKDKVGQLVLQIWSHVLPYLKVRCTKNAINVHASSRLLAELSKFAISRGVWRKQALDLFLDSSFFYADNVALADWLIITDNLVTHDKTTFRDLVARMLATTSGGIFSSKEQEAENRAAMLRRLGFILLGGTVDQYQPYLPDIQERLSENLRLSSTPSILAGVLLCFRVLLIRVSPMHLASLWPSMVTELIQVLVLLEQDLSELPNGKYEVTRSGAVDPKWVALYLNGCKLLMSLMILPTDEMEHFQLYRWIFNGDCFQASSLRDGKIHTGVGDGSRPVSFRNSNDSGRKESPGTALSLASRIHRKFEQLFSKTPPPVHAFSRSLSGVAGVPEWFFKLKHISKVRELWPFFDWLVGTARVGSSGRFLSSMESLEEAEKMIHESILIDLCEGWVQ